MRYWQNPLYVSSTPDIGGSSYWISGQIIFGSRISGFELKSARELYSKENDVYCIVVLETCISSLSVLVATWTM